MSAYKVVFMLCFFQHLSLISTSSIPSLPNPNPPIFQSLSTTIMSFMILPAEIRNMIYQHVFTGTRHHIGLSPPLNEHTDIDILCTSKQINFETLRFLYSKPTFEFPVNKMSFETLNGLFLGQQALRLIRDITIDLNVWEGPSMQGTLVVKYARILARLADLTHPNRKCVISVEQTPGRAHRRCSRWYVEELKKLVGFEVVTVRFTRQTRKMRKIGGDPDNRIDPYQEHAARVHRDLHLDLGPGQKYREGGPTRPFDAIYLKFEPQKYQKSVAGKTFVEEWRGFFAWVAAGFVWQVRLLFQRIVNFRA